MAKKIVITQKLREAIAILASERMADCPDEAFVEAVRKKALKPSIIYKVMAAMRCEWDARRKRWFWKPYTLAMVKHVFHVANRFGDPIIERMIKEML
jgi:hypothetical protein